MFKILLGTFYKTSSEINQNLIRNLHHKSKGYTHQHKWKGRLEYLNRGDPFADKREVSQTSSQRSKDNVVERDKLTRKTRAYVWGNGEHGALGQLGFLHPK